ncbi:putative Xaa-Pro aminopeptidase [Aureobasidium subglaciale]|nr:putative Xaa-Pro aminopeptidase [Aureobasidium subglaciale]KAI5227539.1 putative Xaa-Pro aminopeptidase [Aureobasidium subglaciale]KAI5230918.1 putative Xaa-Pro aminopeptidase [Aureobasidium subglaciale]KAI5265223.1 putative Xaa-Pro aminopeptidase [Aureobasidium subglaciale]
MRDYGRLTRDAMDFTIESSHDLVVSSLNELSIAVKTTTYLDKYPAKEHAQRVAQVLNVDHGLIYLPGTQTVNWPDSDQPRAFRQLRYFLYLSGCQEPDCFLTYDIAAEELILWLAPIDPRKVVWTGRGSTVQEALDKYDIDQARFALSLEHYLERWASNNTGHIYLLHPDRALSESFPSRTSSKHLRSAMDECRVIKDSHEIALVRRANRISALAHEEVLRKLRSFKNEAQVEAEILDVCVAHGAKHQAYEIIAGSGPNAAVLHYIKNDEYFGDRQLMCLDAGAEWDGYAADVTRTFPLSGNWPSREAKQIYDLVQRMQTDCMNMLGPGKRFVDAQYLAHLVAIEGLLELGIFHNGSKMDIYQAGTSVAFFPHGLGHHMGLEVHDVATVLTKRVATATDEKVTSEVIASLIAMDCANCKQINQHLPSVKNRGQLESLSANIVPAIWTSALSELSAPDLQPGMVITCEPGIYFNREALETVFLPSPIHSKFINTAVLERFMPVGGVRIEDDLLITKDGWENLTTAAKGEAALKIIRGE